MDLHVVTAGPEDGPLVVLLHGFPEQSYGWRHQIPALAERGWRVVAPDQRGYPGSEKPPRIRDYAMDQLTADVIGLIRACGRDRAHVVGHDWGGAVAWSLAIEHPEHVASLTAVNMPHPSVLARALLSPTPQLLRSWYTFAFQVPEIPERLLKASDFALLVRALRSGATTAHAFDDADLAVYRRGWREPDAVRGMIAWYRAAARYPHRPTHDRVTAPTLILWGKQDPALGFELVAPSMALCDDPRLAVFEEAGHFVQHDAPERVTARILAFLDEVSPRPGREDQSSQPSVT